MGAVKTKKDNILFVHILAPRKQKGYKREQEKGVRKNPDCNSKVTSRGGLFPKRNYLVW